ncbi:universal stress protein [Halosegnis sp.]|uniref:universal stress protein n=1 Tax=Halosegnis sp. TaxID=2864959 RepID=UPI0035D4C407
MALDTVLLAVGGIDDAQADRLAAVTEDIAGPADARVVLGHVFTEDGYEDALDRLDLTGETTPDDIAERNPTVRRLRDRFESAGVSVAHRGRVGDRAAGIVTIAETIDADMVVVGGRRRSPTGKAVFGSTTQEILLDAPCPVTFVRRDA